MMEWSDGTIVDGSLMGGTNHIRDSDLKTALNSTSAQQGYMPHAIRNTTDDH